MPFWFAPDCAPGNGFKLAASFALATASGFDPEPEGALGPEGDPDPEPEDGGVATDEFGLTVRSMSLSNATESPSPSCVVWLS
jgi:hypothetical protein